MGNLVPQKSVDLNADLSVDQMQSEDKAGTQILILDDLGLV